MASNTILTTLGISAEVWRSIPQEDKERIIQAVKVGSIDVAKKIAQISLGAVEVTKRMLAIGNPHSKGMLKEVVEKVAKKGVSQFLWDWKFNIRDVALSLEFRALKGEDLWVSEVLEIVLSPFREHVKRQGFDEATVDGDLKFLAEKIGVPIDKIRKQFYVFEFGKPEKVEPAKAPQKVEPTRTPETKGESTEKEEIVLEGAKEE
jgi:hypothetical protein